MKIYEPEYLQPPRSFVSAAGRALLFKLRNTGRGLFILLEALYWVMLVYPVFQRRKEVVRQSFICGVKSLGVTATVALFTGMILALQTGLVMRDYGAQDKVGMVVAKSMCTEMGPFMAALILAASVGSAMAAELATMTVSEEIAALHVMSINPVRYLVMPRLVAMMLMCPALTIFTNAIGILGGMLVAYTQLNVSTTAYYEGAMSFLHNKEIYVGLFKAWEFSLVITGVSCYQGLAATNGAMGVGLATRRAVVISFLLILITGYFITRFFY